MNVLLNLVSQFWVMRESRSLAQKI